MKLYHYPNCSTCRKAMSFLNQHGVEVKKFDISEKAPTKAELKRMLAAYDGDRRKLFNTSGKLYREMNIKDRLADLSDAEVFALLNQHGMLVKRPFLIAPGNNGLVGFKADQWESFLARHV